uniref:Uncharacterized protein n=1 Tax=Arundo donax TaxID=35708 RepID=A0A0A8YHQ6_ARUDO
MGAIVMVNFKSSSARCSKISHTIPAAYSVSMSPFSA